MKCLWTDSQTRHYSRLGARGVLWGGGERLVILEEGEEIVVAVAGEVGGVQV